jgi:hypothetical protein
LHPGRNKQDDYNVEIHKIKSESPGIIDADIAKFLSDRIRISQSAAGGAVHRYNQLETRPNPLEIERTEQEVHNRRLLELGALEMKFAEAVEAYRNAYPDIGLGQANSAVHAFRKAHGLS